MPGKVIALGEMLSMISLIAYSLVGLAIYIIHKLCKNEFELFQQENSVPGLGKTDPYLGNILDIARSGSLTKFINQLHEEFGPIASYWNKDVFTVSFDSKYCQEKLPRNLSKRLSDIELPLDPHTSMTYHTGEFRNNRFKFLTQPFGFSGSEKWPQKISAVIKKEISVWNLSETVCLNEKMSKMVINIISKTNFGYNRQDEKKSKALLEGYTKIFNNLDDALLASWYFGQGDSSDIFRRRNQNFKQTIKKIAEANIEVKMADELIRLLDEMMDNIDDEDKIIHQAITSMVPGIHESAILMTWFFYNLGLHPDIQNKVQEEIQSTMKSKNLESMEALETLIFTKQVVTEIVGYLEFGSFSWRRMGREMKLNGYVIKKGTHILNARSLELDYIKSSPNSCLFDPENFNETNISSYSRHKLSDVKSDSNRSR